MSTPNCMFSGLPKHFTPGTHPEHPAEFFVHTPTSPTHYKPMCGVCHKVFRESATGVVTENPEARKMLDNALATTTVPLDDPTALAYLA